jgi:hypothetical protein
MAVYRWARNGLRMGYNKKALVSEGFDDKQVLDFVGCGGKI